MGLLGKQFNKGITMTSSKLKLANGKFRGDVCGTGVEGDPFTMDTTNRSDGKANDVLSLSAFGIDDALRENKLLEVRGQDEFEKLLELAFSGVNGIKVHDFELGDKKSITLQFQSLRRDDKLDGRDTEIQYVEFTGAAVEAFLASVGKEEGQNKSVSLGDRDEEVIAVEYDDFDKTNESGRKIVLGVKAEEPAGGDSDNTTADWGNDTLKAIAEITGAAGEIEKSEMDDLILAYFGQGDFGSMQADLREAVDIDIQSLTTTEATLKIDIDGFNGRTDTVFVNLTDDAYSDIFKDITPGLGDTDGEFAIEVIGAGSFDNSGDERLSTIVQGIRGADDAA